MLSTIFQNLDKFLDKNDTLVVAVSGGVDSVVLLHVLKQYCKERSRPVSMIVAHVNHNLRGKESDNDEKLVKTYAEKYDLQFEIKRIENEEWRMENKTKISNLEAKARELRYDFFSKIKQKYNAKYIVLAHHINDNIETFFLNFIRGAGLNGLTGMKILEGDLFRPMINSRKEEILRYAKKNKLKWNEDYTNKDEKFAGNRIRLKILPEIKKINPNFEKTFLNNLENFREVSAYLSQLTPQPPLFENRGGGYDIKEFRKLDIVLQKMFLLELYKKVNGSTYFLSSRHIDEILKMLNSGRGNLKKEFGPGKFLKIEKGFMKII